MLDKSHKTYFSTWNMTFKVN